SSHLDEIRELHVCSGLLHILWNVHQYRSGSATFSYIECFLDHLRDLTCHSWLERIFRTGIGDSNDIGLLECIFPYHVKWHLAGDGHDWGRICICSSNACNQISCAWT